MYTEDDARTMWCPKSQIAFDPSTQSIFSNMPNGQANTCAASLCMAWRWFDDVTDDGTEVNLMPTAKVARYPDKSPVPLSSRRGFCGLAGKP